MILSSSLFARQDDAPKLSHVPIWAKRAVWYQIFPERFRNGDPSNDPRVEDIRGSWPHEEPIEWQPSSWTGDWYKLQPWEKLDKKGFYVHVQQRRYGGDIQGIIDKLDYLSDLGITALYLTPIFESPSLHKYDARMYHHVDKNFGPDPAGDKLLYASENPADPSTWKWSAADKLFLKLIDETHRRGMKIIIDGVFNHVGMTFWAFEDVKKNGPASPYKSWFTITNWDNASTKDTNEFDYKGWYGVRELPELRKDDQYGLVDGPRQHIHDVVRRWMDPNGDGNPSDGIDGWRLDVAHMVPMPFWKQFRQWVRSINPEAYITGEVWWEDWGKNTMFNASPWLRGDAFDAVMNYRWAADVCNFFVDKKMKIAASEFDRRLAALRADYPEEANYVLMNLLDSHDTDRLLSRIVNPDMTYDHNVGLHDNKEYDVRKPHADEIGIAKLIALFQMTYVGAPMIYYGDEVGMWGGDDPDERKPMLWADLTYDPEMSHPFGASRPKDRNVANLELFSYYKKLIHIRSDHEALMLGTFSTLVADDTTDVYSFLRSYSKENVIVVINNSSMPRLVAVPLTRGIQSEQWKDLMSSTIVDSKNGSLSLTLAPKSGAILEVVH